MLDVLEAIQRAESAAGTRVIGGAAHDGEAAALLGTAREAAERGERVAVIVPASSLGSARETMRAAAQGRLSLVAHATSGNGHDDVAGLLDLGWGVLVAAGPEDSFDLALVARRASEDSGVPFVVVHALSSPSATVGRMVATVTLPTTRDVQAFVGPPSRVRPRHDPAHPSLAPVSDRGFGERIPFALGAAMREYGTLSGRRHDSVDKHARADHPLVLVGSGAVGEALVAAAPTLRELGFDVAALAVAALRPFPGARLVKAVSRALAVAVLEASDEPIAHAGPLVREVKGAFTDALTWVPGFPGIGRVPKLVTGVTGDRFGIEELAAVCETMLAAETGKRTFSFVDHEHALPRSSSVHHGGLLHPRDASLRFVVDDPSFAEAVLAIVSATVTATVGLRVSGLVSKRAGGVVLDLFASRDHARGGMLRRPASLVVASATRAESADVIARAAESAVLAITSPGGEAAPLSEETRAAVREKRARVLPLAAGEGSWGLAGACAGAAAAVVSRANKILVEPEAVVRAVTEHVSGAKGDADQAAERARRAFSAGLEALTVAERDSRTRLG